MKELRKQFETIRLKGDERDALRGNLLHYAKEHPVRNSPAPRHKGWLPLTSMPMTLSLLFAAVLTLGGGTALAAEHTLPGDPLYPYKVYVNEPVVSALTLSKDKEAVWQAQLAERRLLEAEQLAAIGRLDERVKQRLTKRLERHTEKSTRLAEKLEQKGNLEAAAQINARLEAKFKAHNDIFAVIETTVEISDETENRIHQIKADLEEQTATIEEEQEIIESEIEKKEEQTVELVERFKQRASDAIASAKEQHAKIEERSITVNDKAVQHLLESEEAFARAESSFQEARHQEARMLFQESFKLAIQASAFAKSQLNQPDILRGKDKTDRGRKEHREEKEEEKDKDKDEDEDKQKDEDEDSMQNRGQEPDASKRKGNRQ